MTRINVLYFMFLVAQVLNLLGGFWVLFVYFFMVACGFCFVVCMFVLVPERLGVG